MFSRKKVLTEPESLTRCLFVCIPSNQNLGKVGITSFQSRSFAEWQKAGGKNLFPVDPKKAKSAKDLPYMQRPGGKPDGSDLAKGAAKKPQVSRG